MSLWRHDTVLLCISNTGQIVSVGDPTRRYTKMEKIGQGWGVSNAEFLCHLFAELTNCLCCLSQCIWYSVHCSGSGNRAAGMVITWALPWSHGSSCDLYPCLCPGHMSCHVISILVSWPLSTCMTFPLLLIGGHQTNESLTTTKEGDDMY